MAGASGLIYGDLPFVFDMTGIVREDWPAVFDDLQVMERTALALWRQQQEQDK
jgi:hypothetical protein